MESKIVVGMGFGDEGKGLVTDFLCAHAKVEKTVVIRFNGGHQAGHTVVLEDGRRHVFSSFGAGSLRGVASYWSQYCTFSPASVRNEYQSLKQLNINPLLYVDGLCAVTTHYDVAWNRLLELQRAGQRHGSCGVGFGATIERHFHSPVKLFVEDLWHEKMLLTKLNVIRAYYKKRIAQETSFDFEDLPYHEEDVRYLEAVAQLKDLRKAGAIVCVAEADLLTKGGFEQYIFEGAQGILLDMDFGFFPHVTRSNTTSKNAIALINKYLNIEKTEIYYPTRCYQTRHGAGPMTGMHHGLNLRNNERETNVFNDYQEGFRIAPLDMDYLSYALSVDNYFSMGLKKHLVMTCADQLDEHHIPCTIGHSLKVMDIQAIIQKLGFDAANSWIARGATAATLQRNF